MSPVRTPRKPEPAATVAHHTVTERTARGKAVRQEIPRSSHAVWEAPPQRPDPVALLEEQAASRVPELVPIRYGRMLVSPFTFYRGAAYVMASDLSVGPRTGLHVQLCGDAHLSNFGAFAAPDRRMIIGVNDFDETLPGPFEWDLKRLVASFAVAGRDRGFTAKQRRLANLGVTQAYREAMRELAQMRTLDVWYSRMEIEPIMAMVREYGSEQQVATFERNVAKARTKDNIRAFDKLTVMVDGTPRIVADPPLITPIEDLAGGLGAQQIEAFARTVIRSYRRTLQGDRRFLVERFNYAHAARKVVGVGSVGTRAWIVLLVGHDQRDPLFLQIKEAQRSVLEPFLGRSQFSQHGQRVVEGQRLMQAASDIMLGWQRITPPGTDAPLDFYVRQLWDQKGSAMIDEMAPDQLSFYAGVCGETLARAHARSGDSVTIASYMGSGDTFDIALAEFGERYADQNEADYQALVAAVASGRITAQTGL
jgi:uncharacterized protein (DUF2252 family)